MTAGTERAAMTAKFLRSLQAAPFLLLLLQVRFHFVLIVCHSDRPPLLRRYPTKLWLALFVRAASLLPASEPS